MNFIFISPNFPKIYAKFVKALSERGVNVLTIGDSPYYELEEDLKKYATEYYFIPNLADKKMMIDAVAYYQNKYGHIDFLESNNEFWLESDAMLRQWFQIDTGFYPQQMEAIKYKSKMKESFLKAGNKVARYTLSHDLKELTEFAKKVGYPLFAKPDNGVGAAGTYKINNENDLADFCALSLDTPYIVEEYLDGDLVSFDGVCDLNSNVPFCLEEHFPTPVAEIVKTKKDFYYYDTVDIDPKLEKYGRSAVKAFGIAKRNFHIEYFKLKKDKTGLGKKGDFVALEANMRSPGGDTPELISLAINRSYYEIYADVICFNEVRLVKPENTYVSISVSRRKEKTYKNSEKEIFNNYRSAIFKNGTYPKEFADAMGDYYYLARFKTLEEALMFKDFVLMAD